MKIKIIIYEDKEVLLEQEYGVFETDGLYDCAPDVNLQDLVDEAYERKVNLGLSNDALIIDALKNEAKVAQELKTEIL